MKISNLYKRNENTEGLTVTVVQPGGEKKREKKQLISEHAIALLINDRPAMNIVCTPSHLTELVAGRVISEGLVGAISDIEQLYICESGQMARMYLKEGVNISGELVAAPDIATCCTDNLSLIKNEAPLSQIKNAPSLLPDDIFAMAEDFASDTQLHKSTGAAHSCILYHDKRAVFSAGDIGRHNALDKAIGHMLLKGLAPCECALFSSGRIPVDMVRKVIRSGVGVLVSKSSPSYQAALMAKKYGLKLFCRAWRDSYEEI